MASFPFNCLKVMYYKILLIFSILRGVALYSVANMCAYLNSSLNTTGCDTKNKAKCRTIKCEKMVDYSCVTIFKSIITGDLNPILMGCYGTEKISYTCGFDRCALEYYNKHYFCCCYQSICNINVTFPVSRTILKPTTIPFHSTSSTPDSNDHMLPVYILVPLFSLLFFFAVLAILLKKHKDSLCQENKHLKRHKDSVCQENNNLLEPHSPTIQSKCVQILETIHEGQFAKVLRAKYLHELVAVKSIQPLQCELWSNEKDIYEKGNLCHDNVLRFISAEKRQCDDVIQYWIITEYCSNGSLGDYLRKCTLSMSDLIRMTLCILKGLDYLHSNNSSSVIIAHRDIKSSNILVKSDLTCCIADFGLSMAFPLREVNRKSIDMSQVGTRHYMAPEVLRGAMTFSPECFIAVDIYSFALVSWELVSRTAASQVVPDTYELPYVKEVGCHPTLHDMIQYVVEENKRPVLKDKWRADSVLSVFCETIEECWDVDAYARVAARLACLRLSKLSVQNSSSDEDVLSSSSKGEVKFIECSDSTIVQTVIPDKVV